MRSLSWRARALLAVLAVGFTLVVVNTARRLLQRPEDRSTHEGDMHDFSGSHPGDLRPGLEREDDAQNYGAPVSVPYRFHTSSLGFRGPEPEAGSPVVLVIGDSFVFGMGVNDEETFPARLQVELRRSLPGVVVHNAGVPGYTIDDERELWHEKLSALHPDLVVLCHNGSDIKEMARPTSFRRAMRWDPNVPELADDEVAAIVARSGGDKAQAIRAEWVFDVNALVRRLGDRLGPELQRMQGTYADRLAALAGEVRASSPGTRFAFVLWVESYGYGGLEAAPLSARARAAGIPVFEGARAMRGDAPSMPPELLLPDRHFSPAGNALAARQTAAWLLESGLVGSQASPKSPRDH